MLNTVKKLSLIILCFMCLLSACRGPVDEITEPSDDTNPGDVFPNMVMVEGVYYYCYGEVVEVPEDLAPVGTIRSQSSDYLGPPTENDTSNFDACVGQEYAFVDGGLVLFFEGQWHLCERDPWDTEESN